MPNPVPDLNTTAGDVRLRMVGDDYGAAASPSTQRIVVRVGTINRSSLDGPGQILLLDEPADAIVPVTVADGFEATAQLRRGNAGYSLQFVDHSR